MFALEGVAQQNVAGIDRLETSKEAALSAALSSRSSELNHKLRAPVHVVTSTEVGKADVYNLSVDDVHEYYANGVLVHNCWLWAELMLEPKAAQSTAIFKQRTGAL